MFDSFSFSDNIVGFIIAEDFDEAVVTKLHDQISEKIEQFGTIKLYLEDSNIENFSMSAVAEDIVFKFKNSDHFEKVALVTDKKWISACATIENIFFSGEVKSFSSEDRIKAIKWISE